MGNDRKQEIRERIRLLHRLSDAIGIIECSKASLETMSEEHGNASRKLSELKGKRKDIVSKTSYGIGKRMDEILPDGSSLLRINDAGGLEISFVRSDGTVVPYRGLSGGERVMFDAAMSNAMGGENGTLVIEAAELDSGNMKALMKKLGQSKSVGQAIVCTWSKPKGKIPENWDLIEIDKERKGEKSGDETIN